VLLSYLVGKSLNRSWSVVRGEERTAFIGGIAGAIIVALGGATVFSIAAGALILMCIVSVASMLMVFALVRKQAPS